MIDTPYWLNLPSGSTSIEDPDEEIFLLYARKQQNRAVAIDANDPSGVSEGGLGFHSAKDEVLSLEFVITNPWVAQGQRPSGGKGKKSRNGKEKEEVKVEIELHQSLDALRNRRGDTGSVLWRISLHLANYLLRAHHFPHLSYPSLIPHLSTATVLELGSGTGALGLALRSLLSCPSSSSSPSASARTASTGKWIFTDQLLNLPLVLRNLRANGITAAQIGDKPSQLFEVVELDWLVESAEWLKSPLPLYSTFPSEPCHARAQGPLTAAPSLILAIDCIYNPSLSAPLAHTILRHSGPETVVLVASELRDEESLEVFLRVWIEEGGGKGWKFARLGWAGEEEKVAGRLVEGQYVVWAGWQEENEEKRN
ncbi:hypothetical protein JCM21900_000726 [Sporobolomyces salmonicolor]